MANDGFDFWYNEKENIYQDYLDITNLEIEFDKSPLSEKEMQDLNEASIEWENNETIILKK